ncbi:MAG TPA: hypothetical protein DCY20_08100 [Firmicutes bacterium]|nr:hypothetical protein [Bacillota bacterium]
MNQNVLKCPVCHTGFEKENKQYKCQNGHSFDMAKEGYTNLLLANKKNSKIPGDSKEMMVARQRFLNGAYYEPLSNKLNELMKAYVYQPDTPLHVFDAGSGEGYYVDRMQQSMAQNQNVNFTGIDISKEGVRLSAKRNKQITFAVGSVYDIPIINEGVDLVFSVFAPIAESEFSRILNQHGKLIIVSPGAHHLFGLKQALYDEPYLNEEDKFVLEQFDLLEQCRVDYDMTLRNSQDLHDLMTMTPYYWKTSAKKMEALLENNETLQTRIEFIVNVYQKK